MLKNNYGDFLKQVEASALVFSIFTKEEILKLSVKKINSSLTFDTLGLPLPDGLYDPALGPLSDKGESCTTCLKNIYNCPGHFGHFELPVVVVNPLFHKSLSVVLKISCFACWQIQIPNSIKQILNLQMKLLDAGHIIEAQELANYMGILVEELEQDDEDDTTEILNKKSSSYPYLKKYIRLAKSGSIMYDSNKNVESIRNSCIKNILKSIKPAKKCIMCKKPLKKITSAYNKILVNDRDGDDKSVKRGPETAEKDQTTTIKNESRMIMPDELKRIFRDIWKYDQNTLINLIPLLKEIHIDHPTDVMFVEAILILPPNARPVNYVDNRMVEHPQTSIYRSIIDTSMVIRTIIKVYKNDENIMDESQSVFNYARGTSAMEKFHNAWQELQGHIDHLMNKNVPKTNDVKCEGLKQIIEKKAGIIRQHMMGKRVNFAARSVITPDPNLNINEIGIPERFAKQLTYPVMVTTWNVQELRKMILNGPNKHPGAVMIENEKGMVKLIPDDPIIQESIAKRLLVSDNKTGGRFSGVKIVHRHLLTGDILLLNRQPTLHKPSIMAHTARILKGEKTLRLHYANCKAYNADFDGDEMNAHFPQNELARSEAYNIVNVCNQYLVPKDGTPLSGLIQDHVISGVKLSLRGKFFTKEDYYQLVYSALAHKLGQLILLPPAIQKPICLWSGKQVLSTVIINTIGKGKPLINLISTAKIKANAWQADKPRKWKAGGTAFKNDDCMSETEVIIIQGELLCGVLDKMHYGATPYGLIHCVYELYGGQYSNNLLSSFAKLFTTFLQLEGFTLGVQDILVLSKRDEVRKKFITESRLIGQKAAAEAVGLNEDFNPEKIKKKIEESFANNPKFRTILDRQYKTALDAYTNKINKTCIPAGLISKFPYNNLQLMVQSGAKGSMVNCMQISCLLGQIELEGKRPPMTISGRTLPSFPPYEILPRAGGFIDGRFMTGIQPQEFFFHCMAGREGLIDTAVKTSRSGYLQRCIVKHLEGLTIAYDLTVRDSDNSVIQFFYGEDGMDIGKVQFLNKKYVSFLDENKHIILSPLRKKQLEFIKHDADIKKHEKTIKSWKKKHGGSLVRKTFERRALQKGEKILKCPDPVISKYQPDHYIGIINEQLENLIKDYLEERKQSFKAEFSKSDFKNMIKLKAAESLCAPGEPVGMLAAQSIGEPSTQMTLNTFHFAGRGEMNVTLGIPRLREILMFASANIKTPNMDIPFKSSVTQDEVRRLCKKLTQVRLADVLEKIHIKTHLNTFERTQNYVIKFDFLKSNSYSNKFYVKPKYIFKYMEKTFFENMFQALKKNANIKMSMVTMTENKTKENQTKAGDDNNNNNKVEEEEISSDEDGAEVEESKFKRNKFEDSDSDVDESSDDEKVNQSFENEQTKEQNSRESTEEINAHLSHVVNSLRFVSDYKYDTKQYLWCEITFALPLVFKNVDITAVLKEVANKSIIWETPHIRRAITYTNNNDLILRTDGINIKEMFKYRQLLDLNRLYTNDIHAVAQIYGIEAATRVIINEIKEVFGMYGITVDSRHLSLIADYMTFDGVFQPLSRRGMEDSASPLQQMSFEASLVFLKNAVTQGKMDALRTPSSCLMVGYPYRGGTGAINLVHAFT